MVAEDVQSQLLKSDLGLRHPCIEWSAAIGGAVLLSVYTLPSIRERSHWDIGRCWQVPALGEMMLR